MRNLGYILSFTFLSSFVFQMLGGELIVITPSHFIVFPDSSLAHSNIDSQEKSVGFTINCIQTDVTNLTTITWTPFVDVSGDFVEYQIYSAENGLLATIPTIGTTTYSETGISLINNYYIVAISGAGGLIQTYSDTLENIHLNLNNPSDGTAVLTWNNPSAVILPSMNAYSKIYREYPAGTWSMRDSVPYGTSFYKDTIDICQAFINYRIIIPNLPCDFLSNIVGDDFTDMLTPDIPTISFVTIDTLTGNVTITWNQNSQPDTYGYIIYSIDENGFPTEIDTVWGLGNTSYTYSTDVNSGPLTYSVAAFDSCFTSSTIPAYQTSAKGDPHTTAYLRGTVGICNNMVSLNWTAYLGWDNLATYEIWGHIVGHPWQNLGSTNALTYSIVGNPLQNYCFAIKAVSTDGKESFSNRFCLTIIAPTQPSINYLKVATVNSNKIELRHLIEVVGGVKFIAFQRLNKKNIFEEIGRTEVTSANNTFIDSSVFVDKYSYTYRVLVIDSCGNNGAISNIASTILLTVKTEDDRRINYLNWTEYSLFNGPVLGYNVYRGYDGSFSPLALATLSNAQFYYEDILSSADTVAKTCYYVEVIEGINLYGFNETSRSNEICSVIHPLIYIPNSFTPNGDTFNPTFLPIVSFYDYSSYNLTIFDRWEHAIFDSKNSNEGWSGLINSTGKIATPGTYLYILSIKDGEGNEIIKRGYVNLLK